MFDCVLISQPKANIVKTVLLSIHKLYWLRDNSDSDPRFLCIEVTIYEFAHILFVRRGRRERERAATSGNDQSGGAVKSSQGY